jgi:hypothetical protein
LDTGPSGEESPDPAFIRVGENLSFQTSFHSRHWLQSLAFIANSHVFSSDPTRKNPMVRRAEDPFFLSAREQDPTVVGILLFPYYCGSSRNVKRLGLWGTINVALYLALTGVTINYPRTSQARVTPKTPVQAPRGGGY